MSRARCGVREEWHLDEAGQAVCCPSFPFARDGTKVLQQSIVAQFPANFYRHLFRMGRRIPYKERDWQCSDIKLLEDIIPT